MNNKRRAPRKQPDKAVPVTDTMTGRVVGQLGNLSNEGMLLLAEHPMTDAAIYQLAFELRGPDGRVSPFEIGMQELWADPATASGQVWIGFRFIDIAEGDRKRLGAWLQRASDFAG